MNIGLTYDLREAYRREGYGEEETAEFDELETIAAIESVLRALGHTTIRVGHLRALAARLVQGERWDLVFNLAEGLHGYGREAQVPALLEAYRIPYTLSDPLVLSLALHKAAAKRYLRDHGICTPDFEIVESLQDLERVALPYPLFVKPIAEGSSKGICAASKVQDRAQLRTVCENLLQRYPQPVLVERFLPGREFTVGILGSGREAEALGAMEVLLRAQAEPEVYSYANKKDYGHRVQYRLAEDEVGVAAMRMALAVWTALGGRDAGRIDLRCDEAGRVQFIEANPLAGLHPENSDLVILGRMKGITYSELIERIILSAACRIPAQSGARSTHTHTMTS
jgi:D-alanine-D-alanine ligase